MEPKAIGDVSCVEYRKDLKYGLWDGAVHTKGLGSSEVVELDTPSLSICTLEDATYLGTAEGEVWRVAGTEKTRLSFEKNGAVYSAHMLGAIIGMHVHEKALVVVGMHGKALVYDLLRRAVTKDLKINGVVSFSTVEGAKLLCVVDNTHIQMYDLACKVQAEKRCLVEDAKITEVAFVKDGTENMVVYGTDIGKVCVDYLVEHVGTTGYVFKAHKKEVDNKETFYPVTVVQSLNSSEVVTCGAEGKAYLWDIRIQKRIKTLYTTTKTILGGCMQKQSAADSAVLPVLALVLGNTPEALYSIEEEASTEIALVSLKETGTRSSAR
ncbi:hypothetical protein NECID01_1835 [Nematocida sp. AWRm77]|nr:hypothetical protein NECID01_1835 [Nematocida sp. AWRm77]